MSLLFACAERITDRESSYKKKADATAYLATLIKEILPIPSLPPVVPAIS
ncbi:MAG: hypothetical protein HZA15_15000 [Nitrospirae bacterium]|nr:hypothetical protein [Nitrospirota bacterium]